MIEHDEICELIPHSGQMCLLERVIRWDETSIECESGSHMLSGNPLRNEGSLPSIYLVEYGAQAMAVHGSLLAREQGRKFGNGYLAALRDLQIVSRDVSQTSSNLYIEAKNLMAQGGSLIYNFRVKIDNTLVVQGRATVVEVTNSE